MIHRHACLALLVLAALLDATAARAQGNISSVVVYSDRAQVTRSQAVDCAAGAANFAGLPSTLDAKTLWATVDGGGSVVGVTHKEEATGPRPRADALQQQIRQLDEQIAAQNAELEAVATAEQKVASFREHMGTIWGRQSTGPKPAVASWDAALDLMRQQTLAASQRRRTAHAQLRDLYRKRAELRDDLAAVEQDSRRTTFKVTAVLRCTGRRNVQLSYVVPNATWRVGYQVRAEPAQGTVAIVVQAVVQQGTGEDWTSTALAVSTANLQRQNTPPQMGRMRVSTYKPAEVRKILTRRFEHRQHLTTSTATGGEQDVSGKKQGEVDAGEPDQGLAMMLPAAARVSVPADGREVVVVLDRRSLRAELSLETVPKLFPFVYNRLALRNPFAFPMLPGPIELYHGRAFIGRAETKLRAPREPFAISLGVNAEVQVNRWVKKEELQGSGALGSRKRLHHRYLIQVGNWTQRPQKIRVLENVPVSQLREIDVSLTDDTTTPTSWNKTDGIVTWELQLPARAKKLVKLGYTVSLPDAYEVTGY
jgi:uncharacterized protein (TIGR02231 family)